MSRARPERDDAAFGAWVAQHGDGLLRSAYLMTGSRPAAEDLVQSVLLRALPRWRAVAATQDPLAYVRRALLNERTDTWRRGRRSGELLAAAPPERAVEDVVRVDLSAQLVAALQTLPHGQRAAVVLRYLEDLPDDDIAAALGCSPVTVRSQVSRGLAKLRPLLDPDDERIPS